MALARKAVPQGQMPSVPEKKQWITFAKPAVQGAEQVLEYLGRYVHKTAIGNHAVVAFDDHTVTFRYTDSRTHQRKRMTLSTLEFLRRFLQHVPPKGFHRVRCFGLLHPRYRVKLRRLQLLLGRPRDLKEAEIPATECERSVRSRCPSCGADALIIVRTLDAAECRAWSASMKTLLDITRPGLATARAPPRVQNSKPARVA